MKAILPLVLSFAACSIMAQNNKVAPADPAPVPTPIDSPTASPPTTPARTGKAAKSKAAAAPGVMAQPVVPPPVAEKGNGGVGFGAPGQSPSIAFRKDRVMLDGDTYLPRSAKTGRTLVVQTSSPDATGIANAEEDLSVMALILRKATGSSRNDDTRKAMGIEVFGSSSGARNMYVEGYGALFLLGVRFPLIAPTDNVDETVTKDEPDNDWTDALKELRNSERNVFELHLERTWNKVNQLGGEQFASEDYDADKVEDLKTGLLQALKNATHIRALKPDESVTVVIQGAESMRMEKAVGRGPGGGAKLYAASSRRDSGRDETVMTVRVKKSDVDTFAKGNLDLAGFRKKAAIQTYFRRGDGSVATSPFLAPPK